MRILIFYTSALGWGHKRSALAIKKAIKKLYPKDEVFTLNALQEATTNIEIILRTLRIGALKLFPYFLEYLYKNEEIILKNLKFFENIIYSYYKNKFEIIIKKTNPDVIVCTHAFPCSSISKLNIKIPLVYVVTDFDILSYHLRTNADIILVPNTEIKSKMEFLNKKIFVTGIPIDQEFSIKKNKSKLLKKYKLDKKPTLLILGGGAGMGYFEKIIELVNNDFQIITCVGNNVNLKNKLLQRFPKIKVFGHTENIDEIYRLADVAITKPGGLTSSELLAIKLPIIITNPLPGIEQKNANYLIYHNVAIGPKSLKFLKQLIKDLIKDKKKIKLMKQNSLKIANPKASVKAARIIKNSIKS